MKKLFFPIVLLCLFSIGIAQAQSLLTGVSNGFCSSKGGRFTPTNTAGVGAEVGECYIPPSFSGSANRMLTTPSVPSGTAGTLGAAAGFVGALGNFMDALDSFNQTNTPSCRAASGECAPSNVDAMTFDHYAVEGIPDIDGLKIYLADMDFAGRATFMTYAMLGDLGRMPKLADQIAKACAGSLGAAQLACMSGAMTEAEIKYSPAIARQCGDLEDPMRGICAARVQMELTGLKPGDCVGECPLRLRLGARMDAN